MTEEEKVEETEEEEEEEEELTFEAPKAKSFGDVPESEKANPKIGHAVEFRRKHKREPWEQKNANARSFGDVPESEKDNPKIGRAVEMRRRHSKEPWEHLGAITDNATLIVGAAMMAAPLAIVMGLLAWPSFKQ